MLDGKGGGPGAAIDGGEKGTVRLLRQAGPEKEWQVKVAPAQSGAVGSYALHVRPYQPPAERAPTEREQLAQHFGN